ncbi:trypsin-like serine peptidase [Kitasatospora sp. NPDC058965]|uniref:trypsin-like serine peptidase n=1 Tax=Kitasatospora sp. NPDC058965 TaxID=3346682 RepID=UPI0036B2453D
MCTAVGTATAQAPNGPAAAPARAASSTGSTSSPARLSDGTAVDSAAAASRVRDYWTPERMKDAIPLDVPEPATPPPSSTGTAGTPTDAPVIGAPGRTPPAAPTVTGRDGSRDQRDQRDPRVTESAVVGKVFFTDPTDGQDHVCTGSALNSPSKQLVITAGSCVHGGQGRTWMTNWVYAPQYRSGSYPFGTFAAKDFRTFIAWTDSSAPGRDVGVVTTWPQDGTRLVDATGGQGFAWDFHQNVQVMVLTYSLDRSNGEIQQWCSTTTTQGFFPSTIGIYCKLGSRAPGGPWLQQFDDPTGLGYVNGLLTAIDCSGFNQSPYFDDAVKSMVDAQGSAT